MKRYGFIWLIAALTLGSCAAEHDISIPVGGSDKSIRFSLNASFADGGSRALNHADENTIHTIDVLAFYRDEQGVYRYAYTASDIRRNNMTVTATVKGYSALQQFVVLVNGSDELSAAGIGLNEPLEDAVRKLVCTKGVNGQWNARNNGSADFDYIPMYAKTDPVIVGSDNQQIGTISLIRMLARIDVRIGSGVSDFKLTEALLYNPRTAGYVAYDFSGFATDRAHKAAVPAADTNTGDPILPGSVVYEAVDDDDPKGVIERTIYAYESPAYDESERLTGMALVIGGEYNGTLGYYRVNLKTTDDADPKRLSSHILRNHLYHVEIGRVSGPGYQSPDEAYLGGSRLTATVTEWTLVRQQVTDSQWWLSVTGDEWTYPADGGSSEVFAETNYTLTSQGFESGLRVDASKIVYTPAVASGEGWLKIENISGANGWPTRTIGITAEANPTRKKRSAKVYVTAGNLSKAIHIVQGYNAPIWTGTSNCYMIRTGDTSPLSIPMTQVLVAMGSSANPSNGFLGTGWISDYGKLKAQVLWSDVNKFGTADAVVHSVSYIGAEEFADSEIVVVAGSAEGNTGIILYEDRNGTDGYQYKASPTASDDKIIWSWHIWNTPYHPYNEDGTPNGKKTGNQSLTNELWMDRNLGATSNTPGNAKTYGFYYQWGRKDPFRGDQNRYYPPNTSVTEKTSAPAAHNLGASVSNPATFYTSHFADWFANSINNQNGNLWGGGDETDFLHTEFKGHRKSVYDPCPDGYRLPRDGEWEVTSWSYVNTYRIHNGYGGYYPFTGGISSKEGYLQNSGFGYYWKATPSIKYPGRGSSINVAPAGVSDGAEYRAIGYPIRCRAQ